MNSKYFADAYGVDVEALKACIRKALQIAKSDDEVARIVFYSYTKDNFEQVINIFGQNDVKQMFSHPVRYSNFPKPFSCATSITYKKECEYRDAPKDVVVCCHVDSKEAFKVDDYRTAKYIIALSWLPDGLNEWKARWNAQNVLDNDTEVIEEAPKNNLLLTALKEMDIRMYETKSLSHPNDEETCKTYIRAIHKYLPEVQPREVENYLVTELGWENKNASKVGALLQRLKEGRTFRGGQTTYLKEYYNRWKGK